MGKSMYFQFMLFFILYQLQRETTEGLDWPVNQSPVQLLGLFPEQSKNDTWTIHCRSMFRSAIILSQEYNITFQGQYLGYDEISTDDSIMVSVDRTCQKVSRSNIVGFVGPAYSREVPIFSSFAHQLGITSVSYSASSPDLSTIDNGAFYRTVPSDENTVLSLISLFEKYKWKSCIIIYQNDDYGYDGMKFLSEKFHEINIKPVNTITFHLNKNQFDIDLKKTLINSLSRIVILWTNENASITILNQALEENLIGSDFVWISTSTISLNNFNPKQKEQLVGLITLEPVHGDFIRQLINTTLLNQAYQIWKFYASETFPGNNNVNSYALFTFDATWTLILSLQKLCSMNISCLQITNLTNCYYRQFSYSKQFYDIIKTISFLGVSGQVQFSNNTTDRIAHLYYIIKTIRPIDGQSNSIDYVPVYKYDVDSNQLIFYNNQSDQILWPDRSKNVPVDHKLIKGEKLRIALMDGAPWVILKNATATYSKMKGNYTEIDLKEFDGFSKDLLVYLQKQMGFIPVIMLVNKTTTYNELVDGVANGLYDTVLSSISITTERAGKVDFSIAILVSSIRVMVRRPKSIYSDPTFFFKPFSKELWGLILVIIVWTVTLIYFFERRSDANFSLVSSIKHTLLTAINRGPSSTLSSIFGQILTYGLFILQIILFAIYTATLTSYIIIENSDSTISGIDDIKNGKISPDRVGIVGGSSIEYYYLNLVSQGKKNYYPIKTVDELYTNLISGNIDAALWSNVSIQYYTNNIYCDLMAVGAEFIHGSYGVPVKQDWLYKIDLNSALLSLIDSGELDRLSTYWLSLRTCKDKNKFNPRTQPVTLEIMRALFIIFACFNGVAICIHFLWPYICPFIEKINQNIRQQFRNILGHQRLPAVPQIQLVYSTDTVQ